MTAADAFARQRELQAELAERLDRRCSRDDCDRKLARNSATDLCPRCWKFSQGFTERDMRAFEAAPGPPVRVSRVPDQETNSGSRKWWVTSGCLLCGGPTARVDQRGVDRGPATVARQLIGILPAPVPYLVGARCQPCERVIKANQDKINPVVAAVCEMLGRADLDIFGLRVAAARLGGLPDPPAPSERWGFTTLGDDTDEDVAPDDDDVHGRLARLERLVASAGAED